MSAQDLTKASICAELAELRSMVKGLAIGLETELTAIKSQLSEIIAEKEHALEHVASCKPCVEIEGSTEGPENAEIDDEDLQLEYCSLVCSPDITPTLLLDDVDEEFRGGGWRPAGVRAIIPLLGKATIPSLVTETRFPRSFLISCLGGTEWSPGLYFNSASLLDVLPGKAYYLITSQTEPYIPKKPGDHGAKLTAVFREVDEGEDRPSYEHIPLFISDDDGQTFVYFGNYSQNRWSDSLDFDTLTDHVSKEAKVHWAEWLTSSDRPDWVREALKPLMYPKPEYAGFLPGLATSNNDAAKVGSTREAEDVRLKEDIASYLDELRVWYRDATIGTASLSKDDILHAFGQPSEANPPGLRLFWEYLECMSFDYAFYKALSDMLVEERYEKIG